MRNINKCFKHTKWKFYFEIDGFNLKLLNFENFKHNFTFIFIFNLSINTIKILVRMIHKKFIVIENLLLCGNIFIFIF